MKIGQGCITTGVKQGHNFDRQIQLILALGFFTTLGVTSLLCWCSLLFPTLLSTTHPAVIPYITEQSRCEQSGRSWQNGECLDFEQRADF